MPMTTREANKTKRPALVLIQSMTPKKNKRKLKTRKEKEMPLEEGIERISEIETRQAKIHTESSNATPAGQTRTGLGLRVTDKKLIHHTSKSRQGSKNATVQEAKLDDPNIAANPDNSNDEGPPTRLKGTRKRLASRATLKVRTAIEAKKLAQAMSDAQSGIANDSTDLGMANGTRIDQQSIIPPAKPTTSSHKPQLGHRLVEKRAHTYDLTDPNTKAIRSPAAKRTRASRLQSNTKANMIPVPKLNLKNQVQLAKGANMIAATSEPGISAFKGETEVCNSPIDAPVDLFNEKDPDIEPEEMSGFEFELDEERYVPDDTRVISAKQKTQDTSRPTWEETSMDLEYETVNVKSDDGQGGASSEASDTEYEPTVESSAASDFNGDMPADSDTGMGLENSQLEPIGTTSGKTYRAPFLNETYDDYKEDQMSDGDASISIRRAYYGNLLDGFEGSQPVDRSFSLLDDEYSQFPTPRRNTTGESMLTDQSRLGVEPHRNITPKKQRWGDNNKEDNQKFPPADFHYHNVHHERSPTITHAHGLLNNGLARHENRNQYSGNNVHDDWSERPGFNPPPMADQRGYISQKKGKERYDLVATQNSDFDDLRATSASGQINETFNAVNDFGGMSDQDEFDQGEEYIHAKSSPLKNGRRLDNQFIIHINDTPKARPVNKKRSTERRSNKSEYKTEPEVKPASDLKIRARVKNEHLPVELTQPVDIWKAVILPTFFNWLASQEDPWNQTQGAIVDALETICRACVRGSYTLKRNDDTSGVKSTEYKRIVQKISDWKSKLGSTAIWAINTIFECRPEEFGDSDETRVAWANWHQYGCRFLFADVETNPPKGMFQSNAFLHVLGAHFALFATDEKAWVPGLTCDSIKHEPWGAIAIAAAAVERAVVLWSDRDLTVEIMGRAAKSKSHAIEFTKKMNAKGVETQSHALFSETRWGSRTQYYYRNIKAKVKKGTWNWAEIYGLLGPHINALQRRERFKPKVQKPVVEAAELGDDDLLEDAADMSGHSFQPAPSKPWISKASYLIHLVSGGLTDLIPEMSQLPQSHSHQTSRSAVSSNPGLLQTPPLTQVSSRSPRLSALPAASSAPVRVSLPQPQPMPGTRHAPYLGLGTQPSVAENRGFESDMAMTTHTTADSAAQFLHPTRLHRSLAPFNSTETYTQEPQEPRSKAIPTLTVEAAPRDRQRHLVSSGTWAEASSRKHSQQREPQGYLGSMDDSSQRIMDTHLDRHSSAQNVAAVPVKQFRKAQMQGQVPSTTHYPSQPEAGPSRR